jgi:hypothetical protein
LTHEPRDQGHADSRDDDLHQQFEPVDAPGSVGMPSARAIAVPMNAETIPTRIVSSTPMGCLPGTS